MTHKVIAIVGPTAVGKTKLSIQLAQTLNGEIISGDSMQIYKGLDIGTDKITKEAMQDIPHYMIDIKNPDESFSVAEFQTLVRSYIKKISNRQRLPIIVGGSGFYIRAALYDYHFDLKRNKEFEQQLQAQIEKKGIIPFYEKLKRIDPKQAAKIHPNNKRKIIRALEIYETTGQTMTERHAQQQNKPLYDVKFIGLTMERKLLYERINQRVDQMISQGLIEEVKQLYKKGYQHCQSMQGIGYKELIPYIEDKQDLQECIDTLKRNSRRFAKRQYTWFKNQMDIKWYEVHPDQREQTFEQIITDLAGLVQNK